ncbi:unnamed protein product [Rangifer tarandus platyrhynchus]|uniref:Uncharacterized protein n=1 Tax=Rangifer tarandus platyrhynchus TaxID=3082113 RepID=A0ACB1KDG3_RANTA
MPGDPLPAQALGACVSFTLFPGAQHWGGRGHPNLSAAGDEPGVPPAALMGSGGQSCISPAEGGEEAPGGDLPGEHAGAAAPGLLRTAALSAPGLRSSQPSDLGGACARDLCPGRRAQGILHLSVWIITTSCLYYFGHIQQEIPGVLLVILKHQQTLESADVEGLQEQQDMDLSPGSTFSTSALAAAEAVKSPRRPGPGRDPRACVL